MTALSIRTKRAVSKTRHFSLSIEAVPKLKFWNRLKQQWDRMDSEPEKTAGTDQSNEKPVKYR
jgi:hypothetical protein